MDNGYVYTLLAPDPITLYLDSAVVAFFVGHVGILAWEIPYRHTPPLWFRYYTVQNNNLTRYSHGHHWSFLPIFKNTLKNKDILDRPVVTMALST